MSVMSGVSEIHEYMKCLNYLKHLEASGDSEVSWISEMSDILSV